MYQNQEINEAEAEPEVKLEDVPINHETIAIAVNLDDAPTNQENSIINQGNSTMSIEDLTINMEDIEFNLEDPAISLEDFALALDLENPLNNLKEPIRTNRKNEQVGNGQANSCSCARWFCCSNTMKEHNDFIERLYWANPIPPSPPKIKVASIMLLSNVNSIGHEPPEPIAITVVKNTEASRSGGDGKGKNCEAGSDALEPSKVIMKIKCEPEENEDESVEEDDGGNIGHSCNECGKTFKYDKRLKFHMVEHEKERVSQWPCNICKVIFPSKRSLREHVMNHKSNKQFNCSICGKWFRMKHHLKHHMTVHSVSDEFTCTVCGRKFGSHFSVVTHQKNGACSIKLGLRKLFGRRRIMGRKK